jgi:hypothetical protein
MDLLIVAKKHGKILNVDEKFLRIPEIAHALKRIDVTDIQDMEFRKIGNKNIMDKLLETFQIPANSDYHPILDLNAERTRFLNLNASELVKMTRQPLPTIEMFTKSSPLNEETSITPSDFYSLTRHANASMVLRDYIMAGNMGNWISSASDDIKKQAIHLKKYFDDCTNKVEENERMENLYSTATEFSSYLNPKETGAIWRVLESGRCINSFNKREKNWIMLFKAVGRRDAKAR